MISELFGEIDRFVRVEVLGFPLDVPGNNTLLRGFQYNAPDSVSSGRFCWNGSCHNCAVTVANGECQQKELACRQSAADGMQVTEISPELQRRLGTLLIQ